MGKYKIHISFFVLIIFAFLVSTFSGFNSPGAISHFIAAIAFGFALIAICLVLACISFLFNKKAYWNWVFAISVVLNILMGLGQLASINAFV